MIFHSKLRVLQPSSSSPAQSAAASAIDDIPSPRSPVAPSTHVSSIVPFRLKDAVVRRPPVAITNGPLTIFGPPATPEAGPVAIASAPDLIPFTTPDKDAEDGLDYDELEEGQELSKLQIHYRASKVLAEISNREADSSSPASSKVSKSIPPLNLSKLAEKGVRVRQASAQLSRPNKLLGQENEMQAIC